MKIRIINPDYGVGQAAMAARCAMLRPYVGPDVELSMVCLTKTKVEINGPEDVVIAGPEILALAKEAEAQGCAAVVIYCFSDPALEACRRAVKIPVVGGAQAACLLVPNLGNTAGIILADKARCGEKRISLRATGLQSEWIGAIGAIDCAGIDPWQAREAVQQQLIAEAKRLVQDYGVQVLVLGCLSFLGLGPAISRAVGLPVIDPAIAAVSLAESLVRQNHYRG